MIFLRRLTPRGSRKGGTPPPPPAPRHPAASDRGKRRVPRRGILLPTNYFHQSPANPYITRVINRNSQWRSIMPPRGRHMKSCGGGGRTAINPKRNLNLVGGKEKKKRRKEKKKEEGKREGKGNIPGKVAPPLPPSVRAGRARQVDIIVRKLSLSIFRRDIVRMIEPECSRAQSSALRTAIISALQPHKGSREIVGSRN